MKEYHSKQGVLDLEWTTAAACPLSKDGTPPPGNGDDQGGDDEKKSSGGLGFFGWFFFLWVFSSPLLRDSAHFFRSFTESSSRYWDTLCWGLITTIRLMERQVGI